MTATRPLRVVRRGAAPPLPEPPLPEPSLPEPDAGSATDDTGPAGPFGDDGPAPEPEPDVADPGPPAGGSGSGLRGRVARIRHRPLVAAGLVLAVLLAGANAWLAVTALQQGSAAARDQQAVAAARQFAVNLVTTDPQHAQESYDRLRDGATGSFAQQLGGQSGTFVDAIQKAGVTSGGTVAEAGLSASGVTPSGDPSATVLLVVRSEVHNGQVPAGETRQYRMRVTVERHGDRWLVENLEFVA